MKQDYKKTTYACFIGYIVQAIVNSFVPLLFVTFQKTYQIPLTKITLLITINFVIQLLIDLLSAGFIDKIGYRASVIIAHICAAAGLVLLTVLPELFADPFVGILMSVVIYAVGGGLLEVLVSPIIEACPTDNKEAAMSLLHSFYCWGAVGVILFSTAFFAIFGIENWRILACIWALIPLYNVYNFSTCPIRHPAEEGEARGIRKLFRIPVFWVSIVLMVCAGASEISMAQWASAYVESALGISKSIGDIAGPSLFAVTMGLSRLLYGKYGEKIDLLKFMIGSGALCLVCYLMSALGQHPALGLAGCILCGFSVGIMWPGTISISSSRIPLGGTAMFALLAMAGDLGGSIGPGIVGFVTENSGNSLKAGLLAACIFPMVLILSTCLLKMAGSQKQMSCAAEQ